MRIGALFCGVLLVAQYPLLVSGESSPPSRFLDEESSTHVTSATGQSEDVFLSSRAIDLLTMNRIIDDAASTAANSLEAFPHITLMRSQFVGETPILRGFSGNRVLLIVDGVRLNHAATSIKPNALLRTLDPWKLDRIEVLRGPGSVLYGSDAIGGVIHFFHRKPKFDRVRAWDASAEALAQFDSATLGWIGNLAAEGHLRSTGIRLGGTLKRFGDLYGGSTTGQQPFTGFWGGTWDATITHQFDDTHQIVVAYSGSQYDDLAPGDNAPVQNDDTLELSASDRVTATYEGSFQRNVLKQVRLTLSYQRHYERRARVLLVDDLVLRDRHHLHTLGISTALHLALPRQRVTIGTDGYFDHLRASATHESSFTNQVVDTTRGRYIDGATYGSIGLYGLDHFSLTDRFEITLGGRIHLWLTHIPDDRVTQTAARYDNARFGASGSVHARYKVFDGLIFVGGVGQGVRAPNLNEYAAIGCESNRYVDPQRVLAVEKSVTAEVGTKVDVFGRINGSLFYYATYLADRIVTHSTMTQLPNGNWVARYPCGATSNGTDRLVDVVARSNSARDWIQGIEAQSDVNVYKGLWILGSLTWTHGQTRLDGNRLYEPAERIPPLHGLAAIAYREPDQDWFGEIALRWSLRQSRLNRVDRENPNMCPLGSGTCNGTPGFAIVSLRGGYRITKQLKTVLSVENLTHASYRTHGSGIDGPGLSAVISIYGNIP